MFQDGSSPLATDRAVENRELAHTPQRLATTTRGADLANPLLSENGASPIVATSTRTDDDANISSLSRITTTGMTMTTPPRRLDDTSTLSGTSGFGVSALTSPDGRSQAPRQYRNEAVRLRTLLSACRDDLENARRECGGLAKANEAAERALREMEERYTATTHALDSQRRETAQQKLAVVTLQGERDELEDKVREAWERVAELGKSLRECEAARRQDRAQLDAQSERLAQQQQLLDAHQMQGGVSAAAHIASATAHRQTLVEQQALVEAVRIVTRAIERADSHLDRAVSPLSVGQSAADAESEDGEREERTAWASPRRITFTHAVESACDVLRQSEDQVDAAVRQVVASADALDMLTPNNSSGAAPNLMRMSPETVVSATRRTVAPLMHAVQSWLDRLRTLSQTCVRLVSACETHRARAKALQKQSDAQQQEMNKVRERETRLCAQLEAERAVGEAPAARRSLAEQLACLEDWSIIAHNVASLQQRVVDAEAALALATTQKRESDDAIAARRTQDGASTSAAAAHPLPSGSEFEKTSADELAQLQVQYEDALTYVRDELEPLTAAQAAQLETVSAVKAKLEADMVYMTNTKEKALAALLVLTRAYTGLAKESRELVLQRRALAYHALASGHDQDAQLARGACRGDRGAAGLSRWRRVVVAVLAVQRLKRLVSVRCREAWWPHQRIAFEAFPAFTHRLRLPVESRVQLVPTEDGDHLDKEARVGTTAAVRSCAPMTHEALESVLVRWQPRQEHTLSPSQPDEEAAVVDGAIPWLVRALVEAVLVSSGCGCASGREMAPMSLIDGLQRGLTRLLQRAEKPVASTAPASRTHAASQLPDFYSPHNYFTPGDRQRQSERDEPIAAMSGPPPHHLPRPGQPLSPAVSGPSRPARLQAHSGSRVAAASAPAASATPTARKELFTRASTFADRDALSPAAMPGTPQPVSYPAPQQPRTHQHSLQPSLSPSDPRRAAERELAASIQSDRLGAAYDLSTGSSVGGINAPEFYSVPGNGFAHEVLGVIDALDRRVSGALQRSARS